VQLAIWRLLRPKQSPTIFRVSARQPARPLTRRTADEQSQKMPDRRQRDSEVSTLRG